MIAEKIKENKDFILVSLVVALLFVLPHIVALAHVPDYNYFASDIFAKDDQDQFLYASRLSAYVHGNFASDVMNSEHADDSYPMERVEQTVFLLIYSVLKNFFLTYLVLLSIAGFCTAYTCLLLLSLFFKNRKLCIFLMLLVLTCSWFYYFPPWSLDALSDLVNTIFLNPGYMLNGTMNGSPLSPYTLFYAARLYYQMFCYPLMFIALYAMCRGFEEGKANLLLLGAVIFGLFAYAYIYFFIVGMGLLCLLLAYFLLRKDWKRFKAMLVCLALAAMISAPYLVSFYNFAKNPDANDVQERLGAEYGNLFKSNLLALRFLFVAALLFVLCRDFKAHLLALLLIGISFAAGAQVVLGKNIQVHHFYAIGSVFMFISLAYILYVLAERMRWKLPQKTSDRVLTMLSILLIVVYLAIQVNVGNHLTDGETYKTFQDKNALFAYVNGNTGQGSVMLSLSPQENLELYANTGRYLFLPDGYLTTASTAELQDRLLYAYRFCDVSPEKLDTLLYGQEDKYGYYYFFHMAYKCNPSHGQVKYCDAEANSTGSSDIRKVPLDIRKGLLEQYGKLDTNAILTQNKYKLDYFLVGDHELEMGCDPTAIPGKIVFANDKYMLFQLNGG